MKCQKCNSKRIMRASAHCSDLCCVTIGNHEHDGYVPEDMGIGGGDDLIINLCLDCGQSQGSWPLPLSKIEKSEEEVCKECQNTGEVYDGCHLCDENVYHSNCDSYHRKCSCRRSISWQV